MSGQPLTTPSPRSCQAGWYAWALGTGWLKAAVCSWVLPQPQPTSPVLKYHCCLMAIQEEITISKFLPGSYSWFGRGCGLMKLSSSPEAVGQGQVWGTLCHDPWAKAVIPNVIIQVCFNSVVVQGMLCLLQSRLILTVFLWRVSGFHLDNVCR